MSEMFIEDYLKQRLAGLPDDHGDHDSFGQVFGIIRIDDADVDSAPAELNLEPSDWWAVWFDNGSIVYNEIEYASDAFEAMELQEMWRLEYERHLEDAALRRLAGETLFCVNCDSFGHVALDCNPVKVA